MKKTACSVILFCLALTAVAQGSKNGVLEFSLGPAFPMGDFSYYDPDYELSGYAEKGFHLESLLKYRMNAHLGLTAMLSGNFMGVDETRLVNSYWSWEYPFNTAADATPWRFMAFLGGIDLIFPIYRSDFYLRALGGLAYTRTPELTGTAGYFVREASTDVAAAWCVGSGLSYECFPKATLSVGINLLNSRPYLMDEWSVGSQSFSRKISQNILVLQVTAGLGIRIF